MKIHSIAAVVAAMSIIGTVLYAENASATTCSGSGKYFDGNSYSLCNGWATFRGVTYTSCGPYSCAITGQTLSANLFSGFNAQAQGWDANGNAVSDCFVQDSTSDFSAVTDTSGCVNTATGYRALSYSYYVSH